MGRINQSAPGTPVPLSTDKTKRVAKLLFQSVPGLSGKAYVGSPSLVKGTLSGVARVLAPNSTGIADQFFLETYDGSDEIYLSEYAIDVDVAGEGLLISYWTT